MPRFRRLASMSAAALLALGSVGLAQSFSPRRPGLRPPPPPARQAPQAPACGPTTLTESGTLTVTPGNSVACTSGGFHTDNHYWRAFDLTSLGITTDFTVCAVTIGVEEAASGSGSQPITVNLYTSDPAFPAGTLTPIGTSATTVDDQTLSLVTFPVSGSAPKGSQLVVEVFTPNGSDGGNAFFIGSNADPETAPSYISASDCGVPTPVPTADIGVPNMHIVMTVDGDAVGPVILHVDPAAGVSNANGVIEIGEDALLAPEWANGGLTDISLTGIVANLTGPFDPGTIYTIEDDTADYGTITAGHSGSCFDCYAISITGTRPLQHFDAHIDETVTPSPFTVGEGSPLNNIQKTWTLHVGGSFTDVDPELETDPFYPSIETIYHFGVTAGCGDGTTYCPSQNNLRQEMAVFLLKAFLGADYVPPDCAGIFQDVPCPATPEFPFSNFIEDLSTRNITGGCAVGPPALYCPDQPVTRAQISPFLLKTLLGGDYVPPDCAGIFQDVPCPATPEFPFSNFIEDLSTRGITAGCAVGPPALYCPDGVVTREQMAAFLTRTFTLVLYGI
ncbi:MAG TPA: hypothetical protein VGH97_16410 [Thermoanaerobaculia bacterium]